MKKTANERWPQKLKVEYISNLWSDLPQILILILGDHNKINIFWNEDYILWKNRRLPPTEDYLRWKMTYKYSKLNISASTDQIFLKF